MKKFFLFVAFLICNFSLFAQVQKPNSPADDTLWTKSKIFNINSALFSFDDSKIYLNTTTGLYILDILSGQNLDFKSDKGNIVYVSKDGTWLLNDRLQKLNPQTFEVLFQAQARGGGYSINGISLTKDEKLMMVTYYNSFNSNPNRSIMQDSNVIFYDLNSMKINEVFTIKEGIRRSSFSPVGDKFAIWSGIFYDYNPPQSLGKDIEFVREFDYKTKGIIDTINSFIPKQADYSTSNIKYSPDGNYLGVSFLNELEIFDSRNKLYLPKINGLGETYSFQFLPESNIVLASTGILKSFDFIKNKGIYNYNNYDKFFSDKSFISHDKSKIIDCSESTILIFKTNSIYLDIATEQNSNETLYPNPTSNFININLNTTSSIQINISNLDGILLKSLNSYVQNGVLKIDIRDLQIGTYFINLTAINLNKSFKIIKG